MTLRYRHRFYHTENTNPVGSSKYIKISIEMENIDSVNFKTMDSIIVYDNPFPKTSPSAGNIYVPQAIAEKIIWELEDNEAVIQINSELTAHGKRMEDKKLDRQLLNMFKGCFPSNNVALTVRHDTIPDESEKLSNSVSGYYKFKNI